MTVQLPREDDLNPPRYRKLLLELGYKLQRANNYYSSSNAIALSLDGGIKVNRSDFIKIIVRAYSSQKTEKRPAQGIIEQMAESYMSETISVRIASRIVRQFWRQRLDSLLEVKKVVEQIGMSLHMDQKYLNNTHV